eukprot:jgi/Galph1/1272/GphlegSOOS_G5984.1
MSSSKQHDLEISQETVIQKFIPFADVRVSLDPKLIKKQVRNVCRQLVSGWQHLENSELQVERVLGGITNRIFRVCIHPKNDKELIEQKYSVVLVRVFGAEGIIDREQENEIFEQLAAEGIAPKFIGKFSNGRIEGWLNGRCISIDEMRDTLISQAIAKELAKLHRFQPKHVGCFSELPVWNSIYSWLKEAKTVLKQLENTLDESRQVLLKQVNLPMLEKELSNLKKSPGIDTFSCEETGKVRFVDFEYSGWNYRGFDIGNHFCECMGGTDNGVPNYEKYPTEQEQYLFCRTYLAEFHCVNDLSLLPAKEVEALVTEANRYALLSHFYWGMWALCLSIDQTVDFDYLLFAVNRFTEYYRFRDIFLPSSDKQYNG